MTQKMPADNKRFHASGGVCPQTVLWEKVKLQVEFPDVNVSVG